MTDFYTIPERLTLPSEKKGRVETLAYETIAYDNDERKLSKEAKVYLPYGFSREKEYPLLILMHGGGDNENYWLVKNSETVDMIDSMMAEGLAKECIIVTPTFYPRDKEIGFREGGYLPAAFHNEVRNDLLPAIEAAYPVIRDRNSRAFAGLSMGSMTTYWSALVKMLDLFSWFGPYSGCNGPKCDIEASAGAIVKAIDSDFAEYPINYLLCCNGTEDIAHDEHVEIMKIVSEKSAKVNEGENYEFIDILGAKHEYRAWKWDLYYSLTRFFK